jgi:hypothetical protein
MAWFNITNFGKYAHLLKADRRGYVHTSIPDVLQGDWAEKLTKEQAREIAVANTAAIKEIEKMRKAKR